MEKSLSRRLKSPLKLFTFIELLIVIAIIGILMSILLPNLMKARKKTQISLCANNLRMISLALHSYTSDNMKYLPQHASWGSLLGQERDTRRGSVPTKNRPLNSYINFQYEYSICPADKGDSFAPDQPESWLKVHELWGSSYLPQWNIDNFATLQVTSKNNPPNINIFEFLDKKLFMADWIWHMNRELSDPRSQWHESTKRQCNSLFLDGRVSFFIFPTFMQHNTKADVDKYGWY